ncbi:MAG: hypothetical protein GX476_00615 [Firmicutes bacterium]|nr:hypothetical protein [Bacillota bacterium]
MRSSYRILYSVQDDKLTVSAVKVSHHREAYHTVRAYP